jgi:hypothetical protein
VAAVAVVVLLAVSGGLYYFYANPSAPQGPASTVSDGSPSSSATQSSASTSSIASTSSAASASNVDQVFSQMPSSPVTFFKSFTHAEWKGSAVFNMGSMNENATVDIAMTITGHPYLNGTQTTEVVDTASAAVQGTSQSQSITLWYDGSGNLLQVSANGNNYTGAEAQQTAMGSGANAFMFDMITGNSSLFGSQFGPAGLQSSGTYDTMIGPTSVQVTMYNLTSPFSTADGGLNSFQVGLGQAHGLTFFVSVDESYTTTSGGSSDTFAISLQLVSLY